MYFLFSWCKIEIWTLHKHLLSLYPYKEYAFGSIIKINCVLWAKGMRHIIITTLVINFGLVEQKNTNAL